MIDDKQIEEAKDNIFNKHFLKNNEGMICVDHISEPVYLDYQIKQAIELGARWAINEFLKNLWHQNTEEPDKNKSDIITLGFETTLIYSLKNPFFGTRNLGGIQLVDVKLLNGLIYLIYYQKKKTSNECITFNSYYYSGN